jgi:two-component system response regulator HydG
VRELENAIERAAILSRSERVEPDDLPPHVSAGLQLGPSPALPRQISLADAERAHILQTLERFGRNHSGAAEALGIGRTTLWRKLKEYGIDRA